MARYLFRETTFSNFIWINGGTAFYNLQSVHVEKRTSHRVALEVHDNHGNYYGRRVLPGRGGWHGSELADVLSLPRGKAYKVKMVNLDSGTVNIYQGEVYYG
ncbi:small multi-drug export protein [Oceanobacillus picturae]|uniref:Small multi-drug export protein, partial n=1 Tax=Oceanobacillus picturae TaxID=171693 RepID=A0A0U9H3P9_9BACI|nr:hypothetical protein [Oceanobacillus picturae]GAQ16971.1 small multi-drug export protein [Oceanobacillus picturae]